MDYSPMRRDAKPKQGQGRVRSSAWALSSCLTYGGLPEGCATLSDEFLRRGGAKADQAREQAHAFSPVCRATIGPVGSPTAQACEIPPPPHGSMHLRG